MNLRRLLLATILLVLSALAALAAEPPARARLGLCLAGGGARGGAHIGALRVLEELRIPIDHIAGTSIGSIVGGLYAAGYTPHELDSIMAHIDWSAVFVDAPPRRHISYRRKEEDRWPHFGLEFGVGRGGLRTGSGVIGGRNLIFLLRGLALPAVGVENFDHLAVPFRAVAADLDDGSMAVLGRGDLAEAMRASMAIPGAFSPQVIDGRRLIDGGIVRNIPYDVVKAMGADVVIVIDVGTPLGELPDDPGFLAVVMHSLDLATKANAIVSRAQLGPHDVLLTPDLDGISVADFPKMAEAAALGEATARGHLDELRRFSVGDAEYAAWQERRRVARGVVVPPVGAVRVQSAGRVDRRRVERCLTIPTDAPLDFTALAGDLTSIWRLGEFESVDFRVEPRPDRTASDLVITTRDKAWGPHYLRFGLVLADHFDGDATYELTFYHRRAALNARGAEWRTELSFGDRILANTEFYQPLDFSGRWFVAPQLQYEQDKRRFLVGPELVFIEDLRRWRAIGDLGWNPSVSSEMRLGVFRGHADLTIEEFGGAFGGATWEGGLRWRFALDSLDRAAFARAGWLVQLEAVASLPALGADREYQRAGLTLRSATSAGRTTLHGRLEAGTSFGSRLLSVDAFELGGFGRLSGFELGALRGDDLAFGAVGLQRQIGRLMPPLGGAVVIGVQGEVGRTWRRKESPAVGDLLVGGTVYLGTETFLGPVYLGYGLVEGGHDEAFFYVGRIH